MENDNQPNQPNQPTDKEPEFSKFKDYLDKVSFRIMSKTVDEDAGPVVMVVSSPMSAFLHQYRFESVPHAREFLLKEEARWDECVRLLKPWHEAIDKYYADNQPPAERSHCEHCEHPDKICDRSCGCSQEEAIERHVWLFHYVAFQKMLVEELGFSPNSVPSPFSWVFYSSGLIADGHYDSPTGASIALGQRHDKAWYDAMQNMVGEDDSEEAANDNTSTSTNTNDGGDGSEENGNPHDIKVGPATFDGKLVH